MKIVSNNAARDTIFGYELTAKERGDFDYIDADEIESREFFRYRGQVYDPHEFMRAPDDMRPWQGIASDTWFSGTLVRWVDGGDRVVVGRYYS